MAKLQRRSQAWSRHVGTVWQSLLQSIFHRYRPELYYMRGPGPRWRAKHPSV
jgi:hypothetical protein